MGTKRTRDEEAEATERKKRQKLDPTAQTSPEVHSRDFIVNATQDLGPNNNRTYPSSQETFLNSYLQLHLEKQSVSDGEIT